MIVDVPGNVSGCVYSTFLFVVQWTKLTNRKIHGSTGTGSKVVVCQMPLMHVESATFNTWHTLAASDNGWF